MTGLLLVAQAAVAQVKPVIIAKNANHFLYEVYDYGEKIDTSQMWIALYHNEYQIAANESNESPVPGYAREVTIVNLTLDSTYLLAKFMGEELSECYEVVSPFSRTDIAYDTARVDGLTR